MAHNILPNASSNTFSLCKTTHSGWNSTVNHKIQPIKLVGIWWLNLFVSYTDAEDLLKSWFTTEFQPELHCCLCITTTYSRRISC